jgi:hypothetical protein
MNNLIESVKYTLEKKNHQIEKLEKSFFLDPINDIEKYLISQENRTAAGLAFEYLSDWYHWNFIKESITKNATDYEKLSLATYFGIEANKWGFFFGKTVERYSEAIQFHAAICHMAQSLILGWDDLSLKYGHLLIKMLYGKQYTGWHPAYIHPWFMLEIFCKWQGVSLDYSKLNYPKDMGGYQKVLNNWNTSDSGLVSVLVNEMVEFHIQQSDEYEYEDKTPDFPSANYFIYPVEILLWLNIRARLGLPNYVADNELMKMPINNWHTQKTEIPQIELIEKAKAKLLADYPGVTFEF